MFGASRFLGFVVSVLNSVLELKILSKEQQQYALKVVPGLDQGWPAQ